MREEGYFCMEICEGSDDDDDDDDDDADDELRSKSRIYIPTHLPTAHSSTIPPRPYRTLESLLIASPLLAAPLSTQPEPPLIPR